jgi:hypothetical protein
LSSAALVGIHWAAALGTIGLGALGTLSILFGVRTVPEHAGARRCDRRRRSNVEKTSNKSCAPHFFSFAVTLIGRLSTLSAASYKRVHMRPERMSSVVGLFSALIALVC